jgi:hypothetical protein
MQSHNSQRNVGALIRALVHKFNNTMRKMNMTQYDDENDDDVMDTPLDSDDSIPDVSGKTVPQKTELDPLEKEQREAAKKLAEPAPAGKFVVTCNMKCDGKRYSKGDLFDGKLYADLVASKSVVLASEWNKR